MCESGAGTTTPAYDSNKMRYLGEGLMGVGKKYEVLVSKQIQIGQNLPGHIQTLRDRNIFTPQEEIYWPAQGNLDFHRKNCFRA